MKVIIIIVVVVLIVIGGGGAAWYFLFRDSEQTALEEIAGPADPEFLKMETLSVHVIRGGGVRKYIIIDITLEMRDSAARSLADQKMPKIRDVFIGALNEYFTNLPSMKAGLNMKRIKQRLLENSAKAVGKNAVRDVLIQGLFERDWEARK